MNKIDSSREEFFKMSSSRNSMSIFEFDFYSYGEWSAHQESQLPMTTWLAHGCNLKAAIEKKAPPGHEFETGPWRGNREKHATA